MDTNAAINNKPFVLTSETIRQTMESVDATNLQRLGDSLYQFLTENPEAELHLTDTEHPAFTGKIEKGMYNWSHDEVRLLVKDLSLPESIAEWTTLKKTNAITQVGA